MKLFQIFYYFVYKYVLYSALLLYLSTQVEM